jgi:hypothetical protein
MLSVGCFTLAEAFYTLAEALSVLSVGCFTLAEAIITLAEALFILSVGCFTLAEATITLAEALFILSVGCFTLAEALSTLAIITPPQPSPKERELSSVCFGGSHLNFGDNNPTPALPKGEGVEFCMFWRKLYALWLVLCFFEFYFGDGFVLYRVGL